MKKLLILTVLILTTLTCFSQATKPDTTILLTLTNGITTTATFTTSQYDTSKIKTIGGTGILLGTPTVNDSVLVKGSIRYVPVNLTPLTIELESVKYKAFTFPQVREIMKELVYVDYLSTVNDIKDVQISEYKTQIDIKDNQIKDLQQLDKNNQFIIGNQTTIIKNKDAVIHIKDNTIKSQRRNLIIGGAISIGIIAVLLFR